LSVPWELERYCTAASFCLHKLTFGHKISLYTPLGLFCSLTLCQLPSSCIHGICSTLNGTQRCSCDPGFTGHLCESRLAPCDLDPCGDRGKCVPSADGFICQCHPWWQGIWCIFKDCCSHCSFVSFLPPSIIYSHQHVLRVIRLCS
jgi:hypothetical protein